LFSKAVFMIKGRQDTWAVGEWKIALSIRVRRSLKDSLQKIADREYRKLGNLGELLLEWSYEQLLAVGSTEKLLRGKSAPPASGDCREK
jgi:hypothetical protein